MSSEDLILDDESPEMLATVKRLFSVLLAGHTEYLKRSKAKEITPLVERFKTLLLNFVEADKRSTAQEVAIASATRGKIESLLHSYRDAVESNRRQQEKTADDFNLLAVLKLTGKEIRHSMVLAWLLDRDLERHGTHAQGTLGFDLFLKELRLPSEYVNARYWVRREVSGDDSIVDVEIASRGNFLIHIENKIWASEGADQTNREWADVQRRALAVGLDPVRDAANIHALYLTPTGAAPINQNFSAISWHRIVRVLDQFAERAKPVDVRLFAAHYAKGISRFIATKIEEKPDGEAAIE